MYIFPIPGCKISENVSVVLEASIYSLPPGSYSKSINSLFGRVDGNSGGSDDVETPLVLADGGWTDGTLASGDGMEEPQWMAVKRK